MTINKVFAYKIYEYRKECNLTQEKMAELCNISSRHYQNMELGKVNPRLSTAVNIAFALNISLDELAAEYIKHCEDDCTE